jgi:dTDP-N-acetylfucosamine:lipid II N-acetylfucosaminyltransferase
MRVHHIIVNDSKFLHHAKHFFESPEFENSWQVVNYEGDEIAVPESFFNSCDIVFIHFLVPSMSEVIEAIAKQKPVVIQFWGGDYVPFLPHLPNPFLPITNRYVWGSHHTGWKNWTLVRRARRLKWQIKKFQDTRIERVLMTSSLFFTLLQEELVFFPKTIHPKHAGNVRVVYGSDFLLLKETDIESEERRPYRVLLGNSATETNNHLDFLEHFRKISPQFGSLVIPLSYGNEEYGDEVEKQFRESFGSKCVILREMMSPNKYFELLESVDIVVMGQLRQQGLGNILNLLSAGKTLYLDPVGVTYMHLKNTGYTIRSTRTITNGLRPISCEEARHNSELVSMHWDIERNRAAVVESLQALLTTT